MIDVDSQDRPQQRGQILTVPVRITAAAAIAQCDVQHAVGTKRQSPAVVVPERLLDPHQLDFGIRIGPVRIITGHREPSHHRCEVSIRCGVVQVEIPVVPVVRMEGKAQQAFLILVIAVNTLVIDVQEDFGFLNILVIFEDPNDPFLLRHEDPSGIVIGMGQNQRPIKDQLRKSTLNTDIQRLFPNVCCRANGTKKQTNDHGQLFHGILPWVESESPEQSRIRAHRPCQCSNYAGTRGNRE